jgi:thiamine pyrophosphokinase
VHREPLKALLVGNGRVPARASLPLDVFDDVGLVVAADGGARGCAALGLRPDLAVGDFDSAAPGDVEALERLGVEIRRVPAAKDESDLELGLGACIERGARRVVLLGVLGGPRLEHELAAIGLLALAGADWPDVSIVDDRSTIRMLAGGSGPDGPSGAVVRGEPRDFVSLLPFGGAATGVSTEGLRYPLHDEPLPMGPSRGLSNELVGTLATVSCRAGRLLIVHTRRSVVEPPAGHVGEE